MNTNTSLDALLEDFTSMAQAKHDLETFFVVSAPRSETAAVIKMIKAKQKNQGNGSAAMTDLCDFADKHGITLSLRVGLPDKRNGITSRKRLVAFYGRFGFIENRGAKKDFLISEGMYRRPATH